MKSLIAFASRVLDDLGTRCGVRSTRDMTTVISRVEDEGVSFLTISLANFGKDLQKALDQGFVDSGQFAGFSRSGGLPKFLSGFLCRVFDSKSGDLLLEPSVDCIHAVRQFTLMWSKMLLDCSHPRVRAAYDGYMECDRSVARFDIQRSEDEYRRFHDMSRRLWSDLFNRIDKSIYDGEINPKHGPGATAERIRGNRKYDHLDWTERLDKVFPLGDYLIPNYSFYPELDAVMLRDPAHEIPVRVIDVPKTLKTPRIIAIEPVHMQYMQQAVLAEFEKEVGRHDYAHDLLGWKDQTPNQRMARKGSEDGSLATLDLSEASDRVSNQLVRRMFSDHAWLFAAVDATRSRKADVPGYGVRRLSKFASMGSALCFPVESFVFMTVIMLGVERSLGRRLTRDDFMSYRGVVRTYGDDIIVPVGVAPFVKEELEAYGFKVNTDKSFWTGRFRESCGRDYYAGFDVSIVKVRRMFPTSRTHVHELESAVSLRNQLANATWLRFPTAVQWLDDRISGIIPFPVVSPTSRALGRHDQLPITAQRWCPDLQKPLVKAAVVDSKLPESNLDDFGALMKFFVNRGELPFVDEEHLERAGRPMGARIKTRWVSPF